MCYFCYTLSFDYGGKNNGEKSDDNDGIDDSDGIDDGDGVDNYDKTLVSVTIYY